MDECRSESSYFCADPGVELGRAMDAAAHESGSERPEGERVGRLLGAENSEEESGEKPKDEGEAEERAEMKFRLLSAREDGVTREQAANASDVGAAGVLMDPLRFYQVCVTFGWVCAEC